MLQMNHYLTFKSSNDDLKVGRVCYLPKDQQNHISYCVCDSTWEQKAAYDLDRSPHVEA